MNIPTTQDHFDGGLALVGVKMKNVHSIWTQSRVIDSPCEIRGYALEWITWLRQPNRGTRQSLVLNLAPGGVELYAHQAVTNTKGASAT